MLSRGRFGAALVAVVCSLAGGMAVTRSLQAAEVEPPVAGRVGLCSIAIPAPQSADPRCAPESCRPDDPRCDPRCCVTTCAATTECVGDVAGEAKAEAEDAAQAPVCVTTCAVAGNSD